MTDFEVCPIGTAARIVELEAALTKSRAETAAAYEQIANEVCRWSIAAAEEIRALATPDQTAALSAVMAEAREQGMREAMRKCQKVADEAKSYGIPQMTMGANTCRDAILAAIPHGEMK